jgi:hypothetical protein
MMQPVSHICFSFQLLLCFVPLLIVFFLGDIFWHVDPTFAALDITVKESPHQPYSPVEYEPGLKDGCHLSSFACLTNPRHKAEALLPILAISCLLLNSSTCSVDKHLLQTVFGTIYFFNRAKLMSIPIFTRSSWHNYFSPEAMSHLHGNHLMDLMSPSKEAFIRFVILVDLMRYHHHSLFVSVQKYQLLFSNEERKALADFMAGYEGEKVESPPSGLVSSPTHKKLVKGFHTKDIALYMWMKKQVVKECTSSESISSEQNAVLGETAPFTFHFPELAGLIKKDPDKSSSCSKRKHQVLSQVTACAMPMDSNPNGLYRI